MYLVHCCLDVDFPLTFWDGVKKKLCWFWGQVVWGESRIGQGFRDCITGHHCKSAGWTKLSSPTLAHSEALVVDMYGLKVGTWL